MPSVENKKLLRSKFFWIALLYFSEGFPLGAFYDIFPVYFRNQGIELSKIGLLSLLGLAWTLKFLWAPAVDYFRRHRYWMAAADCVMGVVMLTFAIESGFGPWIWIAIGVFTLMSATNDIATDGYTIELLDKEELGLANGIRIGFYRVGMLTAGIVLMVSGYLGWTAAFVVAALISMVCAVIALSAPRERPAPANAHQLSLGSEFAGIFRQPQWVFAIVLLVAGLLWPVLVVVDLEALKPYQKLWWFKGAIPIGAILSAAFIATLAARNGAAAEREVQQGPMFGALIALLSRPGILPVLVFILIFKLADSSMGFMIKPFWVDSGFTNERIGLISVNFGLLLSIAGGLAGGWYTDRVGIFRALWVLGLWQAISNLGYALAAMYLPLQPQGAEIPVAHQALVYSASAIESFTGGLGTAAFLAFLMAIVSKERSTTEYAILSSVFAFSRSIAGWAGGIGAQELGKKVEAREVKLAMLALLIHPLMVLGPTGLFCALDWGAKSTNNPATHGFSEILYEFSSASANNGSGFEGLADTYGFADNTAPAPFSPQWDIACGLVMVISRFIPIIAPLAFAGSLAMKKPTPFTSGTLRTDTITFGCVLLGTIILVGALLFLPAAVLGPVAEQLGPLPFGQ